MAKASVLGVSGLKPYLGPLIRSCSAQVVSVNWNKPPAELVPADTLLRRLDSSFPNVIRVSSDTPVILEACLIASTGERLVCLERFILGLTDATELPYPDPMSTVELDVLTVGSGSCLTICPFINPLRLTAPPTLLVEGVVSVALAFAASETEVPIEELVVSVALAFAASETEVLVEELVVTAASGVLAVRSPSPCLLLGSSGLVSDILLS